MIQLESVITLLMVAITLGDIYVIAYKANLLSFHDGIATRQNASQNWRVVRDDPHNRLAVSLLAALLIILLSGWMFGSIAEDVFNHDSIT